LGIGCILLAGGKGSRFGGDKAGVEFGGQTLLQRAVSNLDALSSEIIIVTAAGRALPELKTAANLRVVNDLTCGQGPLMGIYTGLTHSSFQYNFVVACDMPFIKKELVNYMAGLSAGYDVVMPRVGRLREPLHAIYSCDCLNPIESLLGRGEYKIDSLLNLVKVRFVENAEIAGFDPARSSFFNINRASDLGKAAELLGGECRDS
jgi:molybdopterin-guanine dinucleotide biosynthesis protein A